SPDNKTLASVVEDKVVHLWEVPSGKLLHKLEHPLMVRTVSFSPDSKTLASGGSDTLAPKGDEKTMRQVLKPDGSPSVVRLWDDVQTLLPSLPVRAAATSPPKGSPFRIFAK